MRNVIGITVLAVTVLAGIALAFECPSSGRPQAVVGYSSDDFQARQRLQLEADKIKPGLEIIDKKGSDSQFRHGGTSSTRNP